MKIRWKLLMLLLLAIALVPLVIASVVQRTSVRRLGSRLATGTRAGLAEDARGRLQALVDHYGRILRRDKEGLEPALRYQAREVERRFLAWAGGEYDTRVEIRTRDELQELGAVFNDVGPKLQERQRMTQSLAVAMEIQQHLLPLGPPKLGGFDISGTSVYCDETGGDYYDFIDLVDPAGIRIAGGDVTGHGIAAALLMASARGVLRSHAGRHGAHLAALFEAPKEHLVRDTGEDRGSPPPLTAAGAPS